MREGNQKIHSVERPHKRASCIGCVYHRQLGEFGNYGCHFMLDTGEKRGCPPEACTRKLYAKPPKEYGVMQQKAERYFTECRGRVVYDEENKPVRGRDGRLLTEDEHPPTVLGLALALGFSTRNELLALQNDAVVGEVVRRSLGRCEAYLEEKLCESANGVRMALLHNFPEWGNAAAETEEEPTVWTVRLE